MPVSAQALANSKQLSRLPALTLKELLFISIALPYPFAGQDDALDFDGIEGVAWMGDRVHERPAEGRDEGARIPGFVPGREAGLMESSVGEMQLLQIFVAEIEGPLEVQYVGLDSPVEADPAYSLGKDPHVAEVVGMGPSRQGGAMVGEHKAF